MLVEKLLWVKQGTQCCYRAQPNMLKKQKKHRGKTIKPTLISNLN